MKMLAPGGQLKFPARSPATIVGSTCCRGPSSLRGVCFYAPTSSSVAVVSHGAWHIAAPPPAAGAGPPGPGGAGSSTAAASWGAWGLVFSNSMF